jgi:hypothetical protein
MGGTGIHPASHQDAIVSLAERVLAVDVRAYESMTPERLVVELHPVVSDLLSAAHLLVCSIADAYEGETAAPSAPNDGAFASPYVPFERAIDAAIDAQSDATYRAVADIAFLGQLELRQRQERLARVFACNSAITIVGECDGALRRIRKVLTALDHALARAGLVETRLDFATEIELSLRVRRACTKFRARILGTGEPTPATLRTHLRSAGTTIAMLVGWETYPLLRVRDRLQLREVQRRLLDWLRGDHDATEGTRLWQDLVGFVRMLEHVSRRQELIEHDTRVVRRARMHLAATTDASWPEPLLAALETLEGLDDEVDALLASRDRPRTAAWSAPLQRLARQLEGEEAG